MNNEELKNKIVEIMQQAFREPIPCTAERKIECMADALIAAGLKFDTIVSHTATFNLAQLDYINNLERRVAEAEHRAEVSERALRNRARAYVELQGYPDYDVAILAEEIVVPEDLKKAKNELRRRGKND